MLVLSRKIREAIVVTCPDGTRLGITVVRFGKNSVGIGIDAPKEYIINRDEMQERIDTTPVAV